MKIEINIDDYLTEDDKKQLCIDYVRETLRSDDRNKERILNNMAYFASFQIIDSALTPELMSIIREKVAKQIMNLSDFGIFRKKDAWGHDDSAAYLEVKKSVEEHKHLINGLVKKAIMERDYLKDLPDTSEQIGDCVIDALKKGFGL